MMPDYTLYNAGYDLGFTTRGCIRHCPFCVVPEKEGHIQKWQHISDFHNSGHAVVKLLDNNILALKDWFFENTNWAIDHNMKLDITQGMDIRLLTEEIAEQLARIEWGASLHFAFDSVGIDGNVRHGVRLLTEAGINIRNNVDFYVLTSFNTSFTDDLYRVNLLKSLGTNAFVMQYRETPQTKRLARWANRRQLYWSCDFDQYIPQKGRVTHETPLLERS